MVWYKERINESIVAKEIHTANVEANIPRGRPRRTFSDEIEKISRGLSEKTTSGNSGFEKFFG